MVAWSFAKSRNWSLKVSRILEWCAKEFREMGRIGRLEFHIFDVMAARNFTLSELVRVHWAFEALKRALSAHLCAIVHP